MNIKIGFNPNYGKWFLNDVQRALKKYHMIKAGDHVCVALSGGKDSVTLLFILAYLKRFSHQQFNLSAVHIRVGEYTTHDLSQYCDHLGVTYQEETLNPSPTVPAKNQCYLCARLKRGAISTHLKREGIGTVAYGHHADDAAETLFMNMIQNRKLGSFSPLVGFDNNTMRIIRPMIYLEEAVIRKIHAHAKLPLLAYQCPHEKNNLRRQYKAAISEMNDLFQTNGFSRKIVDALENPDRSNIWSNLLDS